MPKIIRSAVALFAACLFLPVPVIAQQADKINSDVPYTVADKMWPAELGNHRARISVSTAADTVQVHLPWRLRDRNIDKKNIIIRNASTGERVKNVLRVNINREFGDLIFQAAAPGDYEVYFDPHIVITKYRGYAADYPKPENTADPKWAANAKAASAADLEPAILIDFQSRVSFDTYYPMEVVATSDEVDQLLRQHTDAYLLYPETRDFKIKMPDDIPLRWIRTEPNAEFKGEAKQNEYYEFQIGVYAARQSLSNVKLAFSALTGTTGETIPASALSSINLTGIDAHGNSIYKIVNVDKGRVQPFWVGIDIPSNAKPDIYTGVVTVFPANAPAKKVNVSLQISGPALVDRGDSLPWRYSRLRWLNSTLGQNDNVVAPYTPLEMDLYEVKCLGRSVKFGEDGFPESIKSGENEILAQPIRFVVGDLQLKGQSAQMTRISSGLIKVTSTRTGGGVKAETEARMEFDGNINYKITLTSERRVNLSNIYLDLPLRTDAATYLMGIGQGATYCPKSYRWNWNGPYNSFWIGDVPAGLHCKLMGASYDGPLLSLYKPEPPATWSNGGKGGVSIELGSDITLARCYSGGITLNPGSPLTFEFALTVTPVKNLDTAKHFTERYYHNSYNPTPDDTSLAAGVNVVNVHHGNALNPYINYPFFATKRLTDFVHNMHQKNVKVKVYNTVRELSDYVYEMWALRSLGDAVIADGPGGGFPWLREHLVSNYTPRWYMPFDDGTADASVLTQPEYRWNNYYVQGIDWLVTNVGIDGIYLDDVAYDRRTMKRVRKVLDSDNPGSLIDLHSNTNFSIIPANQYLELFPYIDRLWFGEGFNYERMRPEQWLVESSGIPFGLMGDMLNNGGNRWRGMIYGMSVRPMSPKPTPEYDPKPIWKLWDDFGIADARMIGYWDKNCPVRTDNKDVLATAYVKEGKTLVSIASWSANPVNVHLKIDWNALGLNPAKATLTAPKIENFQDQKSFAVSDSIPVQPARGWLIVIQ